MTSLRNAPPSRPFATPIAEKIWDAKYRFKDLDGIVHDRTVEDTWRRIALALSKPEDDTEPLVDGAVSDREHWARSFYEALSDFRALPAGRIVAGAGTGRHVTLFNCYVMGTIPDSMAGIFDMLKEAALTMQQGGGIGYDFSTIRPKGSPVVRVGSDASGPLSFMDVWDAMCRTIMSAGSRRGAMMGTMRCDHPDIMDFVTAKADPARLRMFNLSVLVTDAFMNAVAKDADWHLVHRKPPAGGSERALKRPQGVVYVYETIKARDLWEKIMESTYAQAEPGVIFIDRVNQTNNLRAIETIAASNPCGEQMLPPYGACLLGSINLAKLVVDPFTREARVDQAELKQLVTTMVRMLDNVIDISLFPLPQQKAEAKKKRRIGLGFTGLADALAMCCLEYGSTESLQVAENWAQDIAIYAYEASCDLAAEKGAYPAFDADEVLADGTFASTLPDRVKDRIRKQGLRNSHLLSIAPTGTISLYAGNVSSGIEPIFAYDYTRKVLQKDGSRTEELVEDYAVARYREHWLVGNNPAIQQYEEFDSKVHLPDYFTNAQRLSPRAHVQMQAAVQRWIDSSVSKTINVPEDIDYEDFKEVYQTAYLTGCKGCTTYRPNDVSGSILSVEEKPEPTEDGPLDTDYTSDQPAFPELERGGEAPTAAPAEPVLQKRPDELPGKIYKIKLGDDHATYVTITDIEEPDGSRRPFEVFINTKDPAHVAWSTALTRMISAVFRRPHDSSFIVEELKAVFDPKGGGWWRGTYYHSIVAAIGHVIELHMKELGYGPYETKSMDLGVDVKVHTKDPGEGKFQTAAMTSVEAVQSTKVMAAVCPKCFSGNLKNESGCLTCLDCGHSKCG